MSQEVKFTPHDYRVLFGWYELAFAKKAPNEISDKDHTVFRKLSVMAVAQIEEIDELKDHEK